MGFLDNQLLCTFTSPTDLNKTIEQIKKCYTIQFNTIYILQNEEDANVLCCTYNISNVENFDVNLVPPSSLKVHRKKQSNTLYTINALNQLIADKNNGVIDRAYPIDWNEVKNSLLVTQYGKFKKIPTKLFDIIRW